MPLLDDAAALSDVINSSEEILASLPSKQNRDARQHALAHIAMLRGRRARAKFMQLHSHLVYAELTDGYTRSSRIA